MTTVPVQTVEDWANAYLRNVHPVLTAEGLAKLELTPDDLSTNPYFREVDAFGDPEGFGLELPPAPTHRLVGAAEEGQEPTCQNLTPFPGDAYSWAGFQPLIKGNPMLKNPKQAHFPRPAAPRIVNVPVGRGGYAGGVRRLFRCLCTYRGRLLTTPDEGVEFELPQGFGFEVPAERNLPKGIIVAYFLTEADGGDETARQQRVAASGRRPVRFTGPYRNGRRLPTTNETLVAPPKEARHGKDYRFAHWPGGDVHAADVRVIRTYVTLGGRGETEGSAPSEEIVITGEKVAERRFGAGRAFTAEGSAGDGGSLAAQAHGFSSGDEVEFRGTGLPRPLRANRPYFVKNPTADGFRVAEARGENAVSLSSDGSGVVVAVDTVEVDTKKRKKEALWVDPPPYKPGCAGWKLYLVIDNVTYIQYHLGDPARDAGFLSFRSGPVPVGADLSADASGSLRGKRWALTALDPPEQDPNEPGGGTSGGTSGVAPLEGALAAPATFGVATQTFAQNKTYVFEIADAAEDASGNLLQSMPSRRVRHWVPAGSAPMVVFPDPINGFENAEGREKTADGKPVAWAFNEANGRYSCDGGVHKIATTASGPTSSSFWQDRDVDQARDTVYAGDFMAAMGAGSGEVLLQEYGVPADEIPLPAAANPAVMPVRTTVLASGSAVRQSFARIFGPGEDATPWHQDTVSRRFIVRMTGGTRNGRVELTDPLAGPDGVAGRKIEKPPAGTHQPATFDPSPELPHPRGPVSALGPAPTTGGEVSVEEPLADETFTAGEPAGWTKETQGGGTVAVITLADGSKVLRVSDSTRARASHARFHRGFPDGPGSSLALAVEERVVSTPYGAAGNLERGRIHDNAGNLLAGLLHGSVEKKLALRARGIDGRDRVAVTSVKADSGADLKWETICTGVGTKNGTARLLVGKNGATRRVVATIGGIDWSGRSARRAYFGAVQEDNPQLGWMGDVKRVTVSRNGAAIDDAAVATVPPPPDRPTGPEGPVEADEDGVPLLQWVLQNPPGTVPYDTPVFFRMAVIPGATYGLGVEGRHAIPASLPPSFPWFVTLHAADGREIEVGSLYGAEGASGRSAWADHRLDGGKAIVVPDGFTELRIHHRQIGAGVFLFQRFAPSMGTVVKRGFGRQIEGEFSVLLDSRTPHGDVVDVPTQEGWFGPRVTADVPDGCSIVGRYGSQDSEVPTSGEVGTENAAEVPERTFASVGALLFGDGRVGPEIPPGGAALDIRPFDAVLLRSDGTELDAGCLAFGVESPYNRPLYESGTVDQEAYNEPVTQRVPYLAEFQVQVVSNIAKQELENDWLDYEWIVKSPALNLCFLVYGTAVLDLKKQGNVYRVDGRAYGLWVGTIAGAQVLEAWPLDPSLGNPLESAGGPRPSRVVRAGS